MDFSDMIIGNYIIKMRSSKFPNSYRDISNKLWDEEILNETYYSKYIYIEVTCEKM